MKYIVGGKDPSTMRTSDIEVENGTAAAAGGTLFTITGYDTIGNVLSLTTRISAEEVKRLKKAL